ncbi:MAG: DUF4290 domain-containing protein [Bacteroidaceae bacterium]|nr:DUF4290 domain-containing protein [Candidatus Equimonas faecalis]MCQ2205381.1 DUF4290 domain-containing protein [Bacteroidaceae bacterium]
MIYNTKLDAIRMREYGRVIQQMIDQAIELDTREERQIAAADIVAAMAKISGERGNTPEKQAKLWNHLAYIADYRLDIDYPVEITRKK